MKFLIVTGNPGWAKAVCELAVKCGFAETLVATHEQALEKFLGFSPTHVLICEYEENKGLRNSKTFGPPLKSWEDIRNSALPEQVIRRCGFLKLDEPDFIGLPVDEKSLKKALKFS